VKFGLHSATDAVSPEAGRIAELWWLLFAVCSLVFLLVVGFMLYATLRSGAARDRSSGQPSAERRVARLVGGAAFVSAVVLVALLVASAAASRALARTSSTDALTIEVVGHQWWWEVTYPDRDPSRRVSTANEIHVPVGRPVVLKLASRDVIHSFWAPNLHGKRDLIPGRETTLAFQPERPGVYHGQCAEYCGAQHAHMAFEVVAEPEDAFQAWLLRQRSPAPESTDPIAKRGQEVFLSGPCALCHSVAGTTAWGRNGPDLTHVRSRAHLAAGTLPNSADDLSAWVADPHRAKPGTKMPPTLLAPDDRKALVAYLETLE
jgi:cytochrome c oxidase subunit 2